MKRIVLALATTVAAIALAPSASATICIGVAVNGGAITNVGCDGGTGSVNYNTTTGGYFYNVGATGNPLLAMGTLLTQSINIQSQGGSNALIDVYVTQQGITSPTTGLLSTLTSNTVSGLTATLTSYYSAANALWGGTQLQNVVFAGPGVGGGGNAIAVAGPWSETVKYSLNFTGGNGSNFNGTANLTAVPEPATWGLMLLGFGAMGGMLRTRNRKVRVRFA